MSGFLCWKHSAEYRESYSCPACELEGEPSITLTKSWLEARRDYYRAQATIAKAKGYELQEVEGWLGAARAIADLEQILELQLACPRAG